MATNPTAESREQMIAALERSAADTCSVHCPSVKYTTTPKPEDGDGWPHHERCHQARAAIAALRAPERGTWQDISTGPKDRIVDVWLGDAEPGEVDFYCTPGTRRSAGWRWIQGKWRPMGGLPVPVMVQPTHWRDVPPPPVTLKEPS